MSKLHWTSAVHVMPMAAHGSPWQPVPARASPCQALAHHLLRLQTIPSLAPFPSPSPSQIPNPSPGEPIPFPSTHPCIPAPSNDEVLPLKKNRRAADGVNAMCGNHAHPMGHFSNCAELLHAVARHGHPTLRSAGARTSPNPAANDCEDLYMYVAAMS